MVTVSTEVNSVYIIPIIRLSHFPMPPKDIQIQESLGAFISFYRRD